VPGSDEVAERADMADVRQFLDVYTQMEGELRAHSQNARRYQSLEGFIAANGREYTAAKRPRGVRKRRDGWCFKNTVSLMLSRPDLDITYVEGYAMSPHGLIPTLHAWAALPDGTVIDPTWRDPDRCAYFGVPIPEDSMGAMLSASRCYGFFSEDWRRGYPTLTLGRIPTPDEIYAFHEGARRRRAS
jgi:hypothetical protein